MQNKLRLTSFFVVLLLAFSAFATDMAKSITAVNSLVKIEKELLKEERIAEDVLKGYHEELRQFRLEASATLTAQRDFLKRQKELLTTLGDVPENPLEEDSKLRLERKKLNEHIALIDNEMKQAALTIAKSEELLQVIETSKKRQLQEKLFEHTNLLSFSVISTFISEFKESLSAFDNWLTGLWIIAGMLVITLITPLITRNLNLFFHEAAAIMPVAPFSKARLGLLLNAAYFVFLFRFGILNIAQYPTLENIFEIFSTFCLALILFAALGKFVFVHHERNDEMGEAKSDYAWLRNGLARFTRGVLILTPILSVLGYINLGLYLAFNILTTVAAALIFFSLRHVIIWASKRVQTDDAKGNGKGKLKDKEDLSPLATTIIEPVIALICVLFSLFFWGMTSEDVTTLVDNYSTGVSVGEVTIDFSSIASAIGLMVFLYLLTKLLQWFLSSRVFPYTKLDSGIRDAVIAICGYVGVIIAVLAGMNTLGLDMSNLAIVAGALSVGIGFGLQSIFSNFVSGLILLFERPVKVGDWVVVGGYEGFIKKIHVRSTEIQTFQNSSVIVPNSQLISEAVTNWTLHDKIGRVEVTVGVAYGSDTEKVKQVLLEVVKAHPQVRATPHPQVLFMNFGDSSLDFEVRGFIRNIADIYTVNSDLRFAIDKAFRENKITIPFPQRDLHVVSAVPLNVKPSA